MPEVQETLLWSNVASFIKEHKLDQDEYFDLDDKALPNSPVWGREVAKIAVWLAVGSNEGYYVHVEAIHSRQDGQREGIRLRRAIGKFWSVEAGMRAVDLLTRFIYGFRLPPEPPLSQIDLKKVTGILEAKEAIAPDLFPLAPKLMSREED